MRPPTPRASHGSRRRTDLRARQGANRRRRKFRIVSRAAIDSGGPGAKAITEEVARVRRRLRTASAAVSALQLTGVAMLEFAEHVTIDAPGRTGADGVPRTRANIRSVRCGRSSDRSTVGRPLVTMPSSQAIHRVSRRRPRAAQQHLGGHGDGTARRPGVLRQRCVLESAGRRSRYHPMALEVRCTGRESSVDAGFEFGCDDEDDRAAVAAVTCHDDASRVAARARRAQTLSRDRDISTRSVHSRWVSVDSAELRADVVIIGGSVDELEPPRGICCRTASPRRSAWSSNVIDVPARLAAHRAMGGIRRGVAPPR